MASLLTSYSHKDEELRDELAAHLAALRREGLIEVWHDRRIVAGQPVDATIQAQLDAADVILLLVSPDFINSDYCYEIEMRRVIERHARGEAVVIPVILRPCEWRGTPFGHLLAIPKDGRAVTTWPNRDEAFHDVARSVRIALQHLEQRRGPRPEPSSQPAHSAPDLRSSNVRVPRRFSEKDRDDFLHEAFEHIAQFFENSLEALEHENPGIETTFRRLDATRFTAVAYRDGRGVSRCTIWVAGRPTFVGGIGYVQNDSGETTTMNENLTVEVDNESVHLKPMGWPLFGQRPPQKMAPQEAAEYLWDLFLGPLREHH